MPLREDEKQEVEAIARKIALEIVNASAKVEKKEPAKAASVVDAKVVTKKEVKKNA